MYYAMFCVNENRLAHMVLSDALKKHKHAFLRNRVVDVAAFAFRRKHALVFENSKLLADDSLLCAARLDDLGYGAGRVRYLQVVEYAKPQRVRHVANNRGDSLKRLHIYQVVLFRVQHIDIVITLYFVFVKRSRENCCFWARKTFVSPLCAMVLKILVILRGRILKMSPLVRR